MKKKSHGSMGNMPKGKSGTGRTMDHGSAGKKMGTPSFTENPIAYAAGKPHCVDGGYPKANPKLKPRAYAKGPQKVK